MFFLGLNTDFVGNTNTINICLILSTIYIVISVSGCAGRAPVHCFSPGAYIVVKTALTVSLILLIIKQKLYRISLRYNMKSPRSKDHF